MTWVYWFGIRNEDEKIRSWVIEECEGLQRLHRSLKLYPKIAPRRNGLTSNGCSYPSGLQQMREVVEQAPDVGICSLQQRSLPLRGLRCSCGGRATHSPGAEVARACALRTCVPWFVHRPHQSPKPSNTLILQRTSTRAPSPLEFGSHVHHDRLSFTNLSQNSQEFRVS